MSNSSKASMVIPMTISDSKIVARHDVICVGEGGAYYKPYICAKTAKENWRI